MEGRQLRDRDAILIDLVGVAGLMAFFAGLVLLQDSTNLGFDATAALNGVLGQLSVTLPAALLVLAVMALELAAGFVLARLLRNRPFDSIADAAPAAFVAAVIKDTFLLGTLAAAGAFRSPVLLAIDVAIVAAGMWLHPVAKLARPFTAIDWRAARSGVGSWTIAILVAIVWAGPVILQLASPVVPFSDVLPNYVAPAEHLRTFGWFSPLTATQSPIYGPSRTVFGFDALLGSLATISNLSAGLVVSAFILPLTVLLASGAQRLAAALELRRAAQIGPWALLAFALTQPFARLADARGTVVVIPLVCLGLAIAADGLRDGGARDDRAERHPKPWRFGRGADHRLEPRCGDPRPPGDRLLRDRDGCDRGPRPTEAARRRRIRRRADGGAHRDPAAGNDGRHVAADARARRHDPGRDRPCAPRRSRH